MVSLRVFDMLGAKERSCTSLMCIYNTMYLYKYLRMYMYVYVDMFHSLVFLGQFKSIEKTRRRTLSCR